MGVLNYKFSYFNIAQSDVYCFNYDNVNNLYIHKDEIILKRQQQSLIDIFNIDKRGIVISKQNLNVSNSLLYTLSDRYNINIKTENENIFNNEKLKQKIKLSYDKTAFKNQKNYNASNFIQKDIFVKDNKYSYDINDTKFNYTISNISIGIKDNGENQSFNIPLMGNKGDRSGFSFNNLEYYKRIKTKLSNMVFEENDNVYIKSERKLNIGKENEIIPIHNGKALSIDTFKDKSIPLLIKSKNRKLDISKDFEINHSEPRKLSLAIEQKEKYIGKEPVRYTSYIGKEQIPFHKTSKMGAETTYKTIDYNLFAINRKVHLHKYDEMKIFEIDRNISVNDDDKLMLYNKRTLFSKLSYDDNFINRVFNKSSYNTSNPINQSSPFLHRVKKGKVYDVSDKKYDAEVGLYNTFQKVLYDTTSNKNSNSLLFSTFQKKLKVNKDDLYLFGTQQREAYDTSDNRYKTEMFLKKVQERVINKLEDRRKQERLVKTYIRSSVLDNKKRKSINKLIKEQRNNLFVAEKDKQPMTKNIRFDYNIILPKEIYSKRVDIKKYLNISTMSAFGKNPQREINIENSDISTNKKVFRQVNIAKETIFGEKNPYARLIDIHSEKYIMEKNNNKVFDFHKFGDLPLQKDTSQKIIFINNELFTQKTINKELNIEDNFKKPICLQKGSATPIYDDTEDKYKINRFLQKAQNKNLIIPNKPKLAENFSIKRIINATTYKYGDSASKFLTKNKKGWLAPLGKDVYLQSIKINKLFQPNKDIQPLTNINKLNYKALLDKDILLNPTNDNKFGYIEDEKLVSKLPNLFIELTKDKLLQPIISKDIFIDISDNLTQKGSHELSIDINDKLISKNPSYGREINISDIDWELKSIDNRTLKIEDTIIQIQKTKPYDLIVFEEKHFVHSQNRKMYDVINADNQHLYPTFSNKIFDTSIPIFPNTPFLEKPPTTKIYDMSDKKYDIVIRLEDLSSTNIYDTSDKRYGTTVRLEDLSSIDIYDNADNRYKMENYLNRIQNKIINTNPEVDKWYENLKKVLGRATGFDNYSKHSFKYLTKEKLNLLMPFEKDFVLTKNKKGWLAPLGKDVQLNKLTKYSGLILHTDIVLDTKLNTKNLEKETHYNFNKHPWRKLNTNPNEVLNDKNHSLFRVLNKHEDNIVFKKGINKQFNNDFDKTISFDKYHNQKENYIYRDFYIKKNKKHIEMEKPKILQQVDKTLLMAQTQKNIELYNTLWMIRGLGDTDLKILPSADFEYPASIHMFYEKPDFNYYFEYLSLHDIYIDGDYIIELYDIDYNIVSILKINGVKVGTYNNDEIKLTIEEVPLNELEYEKEFTQFKFSIKVTSLNVSFIIVRQPIIPNNNIVLYTVTEKFLADNKHPIPFGSDLGTREIPIHVNIMVEFINVLLLIWQKRFLGFDMHTGMRAIEGLLKIVHQWLTLEPSLEHESIAEYHRCYRWLRWEAEKVYNVAKQDIKLNGNKWIREVILEMIDYLEMHHIEVVPILNEIRDTDEWRNIYSDPTFDINVLLDKEKGERKQLIDNRLRLTSARTH